MKILLFGISNVGKTTIGKLLSKKINYEFEDLDEEIKKRYGNIYSFQKKYPDDIKRHRKKGKILEELIDRYEANVVIAVSPIFYEEFFSKLLNYENVLAIELQDESENIFFRLVYSDENDVIYPLEVKTQAEKNYYINEINEDIQYYKKVYSKIKNKFMINGKSASDAVEILVKYIEEIKNNKLKN